MSPLDPRSRAALARAVLESSMRLTPRINNALVKAGHGRGDCAEQLTVAHQTCMELLRAIALARTYVEQNRERIAEPFDITNCQGE